MALLYLLSHLEWMVINGSSLEHFLFIVDEIILILFL